MIPGQRGGFWRERARGMGYLVAVGLGVLAVATIVAAAMLAVMT
ncbi:MAG: hypothetical protein R6U94_03810 [Nitriliruptoraceae bacterium]